MLYDIEYRIRLTLGLYGWQYSVYRHNSPPPWPFYKYLSSPLNKRPHYVQAFSTITEARSYLLGNPIMGAYIVKERYVP